jgi:(+)-trans-carveol dehydrogenase
VPNRSTNQRRIEKDGRRVEGKVAFSPGSPRARTQSRGPARRGRRRHHAIDIAGPSAPVSDRDPRRHPADLPRRQSGSRDATAASSPPRWTSATSPRSRRRGQRCRPLGKLDIIVANAASHGGDVLHETVTRTGRGSTSTCRASGSRSRRGPPPARGGNGGSIVLTTPVGGLRPTRTAATTRRQARVVGQMRTFAVEVGPAHIRVNTVPPTHVSTPMLHNGTAPSRCSAPTWRTRARRYGADRQQFHTLPIPWVDPIDISNAYCSWPPTRPATSRCHAARRRR